MFRTPAGLMQKSPITNAEYLARHPSAGADPETLVLQPGVPIKQDPADLETVREPANRELYTGMA